MAPRYLTAAVLAAALAGCSNTTHLVPIAPDGAGGAKTIASQDPLAMVTDPTDEAPWGIVGGPAYHKVVDKVVGMMGNAELRAEVALRKLSLLNVMWEDTGRSVGSALGPNISDLTLQVRYQKPGGAAEHTALMPVIRFPNFSDRTGDIPADKFFIKVGNHRDKKRLRTVALTDVLSNVQAFASNPGGIKGSGNLLAKRDTHFLVSAQAVFLPIPRTGKAEFNPVVFNYQSAPGSPAVLTLLVTRQGTSMTVIENRAESRAIQGWGQELYFNNQGQKAAFTAERLSAVKARIDAQGGPQTADDKSALQKGADVIFLIQVPLVHKHRGYLGGVPESAAVAKDDAKPAPPAMAKERRAEGSDVEQAVVGHGRSRGPFTEGNDLTLVRDERFPIRITVQFYKATSNGVVDPSDLDKIARSIGNVYEHADFVGSLVIPPGDPLRPTAWSTVPREWFPW